LDSAGKWETTFIVLVILLTLIRWFCVAGACVCLVWIGQSWVM
jgi:hypothetical protein